MPCSGGRAITSTCAQPARAVAMSAGTSVVGSIAGVVRASSKWTIALPDASRAITARRVSSIANPSAHVFGAASSCSSASTASAASPSPRLAAAIASTA
jgi:hypothetical protein